MSRTIFFLLLTTVPFFSLPSSGQTSPSLSSSEIQLQLNGLNVLGSVLYIAAHPDDENTRLLTYLVKEKQYRTGYLSLTRGDGGQNLIGPEQGELLGLIRTQELLAARRIDGAEQFFTRAYDFGYSKSPEETLAFWGKDSILSDMVWVIRNFQPDVIICRFPATGEGGHGHHTASAMLAQEAFTAAADPKQFPNQLKRTAPWQAKRLLWNVFQFGAVNLTAPDQFKIDVGLYNPLLGKGYRELAAESRTMHKSQAFGTEKARGSQLEYFKTILGDTPAVDLLDGVDKTWNRLNAGSAPANHINKIIQEYIPAQPHRSVPALIDLYRVIQKLPESQWRNRKAEEVKRLLLSCSGLWFEAYSGGTAYAPGENLDWRIQAINRSPVSVVLKSVHLGSFDTVFNFKLQNNQLLTYQHGQLLEKGIPLSQPYWLERPRSQGRFNVTGLAKTGHPLNDDAVAATFLFEVEGQEFSFSRPVVNKYEDPVKGEIYRPMVVAPVVTVTLKDPVYVFANGRSQTVDLTVKSFGADINGSARLKLPQGWTSVPESADVHLKEKGDELVLSFLVHPGTSPTGIDSLTATFSMNGAEFNKGFRQIDYDHIPQITLFPDASARLVSINFESDVAHIGYLPGAGDRIPGILEQAGFKITLLGEAAMEPESLKLFDAVVIGIRAYNTNAWLKHQQEHLMEYVHNGGTLVVQYNTSFDLVTEKLGPFPFKISRGRVTDELAPVSFADPGHAVLNKPNKISGRDFDGWIQERGLYFPADIDSNYRKILLMSDPGEKPLDGSLLVCNYGKGKYVYTGLAFFRQLPAGVPGALRLFVNLMSGN